MDSVCATCGNPVPAGPAACPFCGGFHRVESSRPATRTGPRSVDLGHRRLSAAESARRLEDEIAHSAAAGDRYLRIVHGHGSTGRGGAIRSSVRRELARLRSRKLVAGFIPGELLSGDTNEGRAFARKNPAARSWPDWNAGNEGVTIVALV